MIGNLVVGTTIGALAAGIVLVQGLSIVAALFAYAGVGTAFALAIPAVCLARARTRKVAAYYSRCARTSAG